MATDRQMQLLLGKALLERDFREKLLQDPETAAGDMRIRLTEDQARRIREIDPKALGDLARTLRQIIPPPGDWHGGFSFW